MKRILTMILCLVLVLGMVSGCGGKNSGASGNTGSSGITAPEADVAMQYMSVEDAAGYLNTAGYTFLDVRKAEDHKTSHIPGAIGADMDAAKEGDFDAGVATMQAVTKDLTDTLVVICYSGKAYAQATTNVLSAIGYDMSKVYTLEGGFKAWTEAYPDNVEVSEEIVPPETDVAMQYMPVADAAGVLETEGYTFLDVRKAEDYKTSHIPGAIGADMDAAKEGDFNAGVSTMQVATRGLDGTLIVVCYSGKAYAQAATNVLSAMGYDMSKVYTLEGGFKAWTEAYPDNVSAE